MCIPLEYFFTGCEINPPISANSQILLYRSFISVLQNSIAGVESVTSEIEALTELLMLLVALSGIVLLSAGISNWLPVSRKKVTEVKGQNSNNIDVISLSRIFFNNTETEIIFTQTTNWLFFNYDLDQADAIYISNKNSKTSLLASAGDLDNPVRYHGNLSFAVDL